MGGRVQKNQEAAQGSGQNERTDNKNTCKRKAGRKQKSQAPEPVVADLLKITFEYFFPDFNQRLSELPDPRRPDRIIYSKEHLFYLGLCMFLFQSGSRSQMENDRRTGLFHLNLLTLSGTDEDQTASIDTMNYLMENMAPDAVMEELPGYLTGQLIRHRVLDKHRNESGEFLVAVDAVHMFTRKGRHPNAVYRNINGEIHSYYYALEAKLVSSSGLALSLATVFIENEEQYIKQDCELKAFYRLSAVLKKRFPQLRICLLMDGLYANKNVLDICTKNQWGYAITFKDGCIPLVCAEMLRQFDLCSGQSYDKSPEHGVFQHFSWAFNLKHEGQRTHAIACRERIMTENVPGYHTFAWLTDVRPDKHNAASLAENARCRWKIENEGFNTQKNGGYELEHNYGTVGFSMKNYYYLLQIGHLLNQLMLKSDLFPKIQKKFYTR